MKMIKSKKNILSLSHKLLILAAILTVVSTQWYPATSMVGVYTATGPGLPSYISCAGTHIYGFASSPLPIYGYQYFIAGLSSLTADNLKIFDRYGTLRGSATIDSQTHDALVMKPVGTSVYLVTSRCCNAVPPNKYYYRITESGTFLTLTYMGTQATVSAFFCGDHSGTVYAFCSNYQEFYIVDITTMSESAVTMMSLEPTSDTRGGGRYAGSYVLGRSRVLNRVAEGSLVVTHGMAHPYGCPAGIVDNLNSNKYFFLTDGSNHIYRIDMAASTTTTASVSSAVDLSAFSPQFNKIINFSYYQYLIVMPSATTLSASYVFFVNKIDWVALPSSAPFSVPGQSVRYFSLAGTIDDTNTREHWFMFGEAASNNIQTWKFNGDLCTYKNMTGSCLSCVPTYYAYSTSCYLAPSLPAKVGPNPATMMGVACSDANCQLCKGIYTTCTACDAGYYLYLNVCYLPASLPAGVGPNTSSSPAVGTACAVSGCQDCKSTYLTCTNCNSSCTLHQHLRRLLCTPHRSGNEHSRRSADRCGLL